MTPEKLAMQDWKSHFEAISRGEKPNEATASFGAMPTVASIELKAKEAAKDPLAFVKANAVPLAIGAAVIFAVIQAVRSSSTSSAPQPKQLGDWRAAKDHFEQHGAPAA